MIQEIKEKCGEFLIPYYNVLDCSKNLCIFCKEKSDSIIVMKESGNTLLHWIDDNYNTDHIYFGKLLLEASMVLGSTPKNVTKNNESNVTSGCR